MIRGTTATLICTLPFEVNTLQYAYFTIMQDNVIVFDRQIECSHLSGDTIEVHLSQEDTLKLKEKHRAEIQLRAITVGGEAIASNIITTYVERILKGGVI